MQFAPCKPQFLRRAIEQIDKMTVDLSDVLTGRSARAVAASTGNRRRLARVLASRCVPSCRPHALAGSAMRYTRPRSSLAEARVSPSFFFKLPEKTPRTHGMTLPPGHARYLVDGGTLGLTQHGNHHVLL
jgi:hypothetical protein